MDSGHLARLRNLSVNTLNKLVTEEGIYASTAQGAEGLYHGFFGRDTAITAYLIARTEHLKKEELFLHKAVSGLVSLVKWQSLTEDFHTGAELGKFPHEIRISEEDYRHLTVDLVREKGWKPWYVDPEDKVMKNWDSNDSTQLWIIVISRMYEQGSIELTEELRSSLRYGLLWCLKNLREYGGFSGYRHNPERKWGGLANQTWKDSEGVYIHTDGSEAPTPIRDVFVNALTWCALKQGAKLLRTYDNVFADLLVNEADGLKKRFNDPAKGFLIQGPDGAYFAEALDGKGRKLEAVSADAAMCLWAYSDGETVINAKYLPEVVKRVMRPDMFDPEAGIRTYSSSNSRFSHIPYHRGPDNFWPFVTALVSDGFTHFGYKYEAKLLLTSMVNAIRNFDSCIELFVKNEDKYVKFTHPHVNQVSSSEQAWTAASLYYATHFIENYENINL